jgi:hypothetical protein
MKPLLMLYAQGGRMFEEFWKLYPRKVSKRVAQKIWERMPKDDQEAALEALPVHIKYWRLKETDTEFVPHAATWLNQGRWEDELDMQEKKPPSLPWYSDEQLTMAKAREVGVNPLRGESFSELRKRIAEKIRALA